MIVDAQTQSTRTIVCCFATNVVTNACACRREPSETRTVAPATMIGRPKKEALNALNSYHVFIYFYISYFMHLPI